MPDVHPRICVSGISSWNASLDEDLALYQELGIHTIGAAVRKLGSPADVDRLRSSGLRVANVIGVGPFHLDDPSGWEAQRNRVRRAVEVAMALGAPHVVLTTGPAGALEWEAAADAFSAAVGPLLPCPVGLCVEHTNSLRVDVGFVHTLADAIDLARRLDLSVCMEVNACWAERRLADRITAGIDRIAVVQVSDFAVGTHCTPDRLVPGDGDIPLDRILGQLAAAGYAGVFDLELVGPRIEAEGYRSAIGRSCDRLGDLLASAVGPSAADSALRPGRFRCPRTGGGRTKEVERALMGHTGRTVKARPVRVACSPWLGPRRWATDDDEAAMTGAHVLVTTDDVALAARRSPAVGPARGTVVLAHGLSASKDHPEVVEMAARLNGMGLTVVTYDARGHGESGGRCTLGDLERHDVAAALDWARDMDGPVVLVGASMGGIAVLRHAVSGPELAGVVVVSTPAKWRIPARTRALLTVGLTRTKPGRWVAGRRTGVRLHPVWTRRGAALRPGGSGLGSAGHRARRARPAHPPTSGPRSVRLRPSGPATVPGRRHGSCLPSRRPPGHRSRRGLGPRTGPVGRSRRGGPGPGLTIGGVR